jgi:hypothetical protein
MKIASRAIAGAWLAGCVPPTEDPLPQTEPVGEHLRFWAEPAAPQICEGTLPHMDAYVGELKRMHESDADLVVDYYWFPDDEQRLAEICEGKHVWGCSELLEGTSRSFGRFVPMMHELVHAVRSGSGGSQLFFEEGAAELWGDHTSRSQPRLEVAEGIESVARQQDLSYDYYSTAGQFAGFLTTRFGRDLVAGLAGDTEPFESYASVESYFDEATGESLPALISEFEAADFDCDRSRFRDAQPNCAVAEPIDCSMANELGQVELTIDLSCDAAGVIGPRDDLVWREFVVQPIDESLVFIYFEAEGVDADNLDEHGQVTIERCGGIECGDLRQAPAIDIVSDGTDYDGDPALLRFTRYVDAPSDAFARVDVLLSFGCPET